MWTMWLVISNTRSPEVITAEDPQPGIDMQKNVGLVSKFTNIVSFVCHTMLNKCTTRLFTVLFYMTNILY